MRLTCPYCGAEIGRTMRSAMAGRVLNLHESRCGKHRRTSPNTRQEPTDA